MTAAELRERVNALYNYEDAKGALKITRERLAALLETQALQQDCLDRAIEKLAELGVTP